MNAGEQPNPSAEAGGCRLLLRGGLGMLRTLDEARLERVFGRDAVVGLLLEVEEATDDELRGLRRLLNAERCALLLVDEVRPVKSGSADGVHLREPARVRETRRRLGPAFIIGASCGLSRHLAMVAGEDGADYVLFGEPGDGPGADFERLADLAAWWSELFLPPCAVAIPPDPVVARRFASTGADFLVPDGGLWTCPDGVEKRLADLEATLAPAPEGGSTTP